MVGVSDCTNGGLPEGKVFISGLGIGGKKRKVLVTRTPCTKVDDMAILPMVSSKASKMSLSDWENLCSMPFGAIMFASPLDPMAKSLPEQINKSDLDGDLFCTIWDESLVSYIEKGTKRQNCSSQASALQVKEESVQCHEDYLRLGTLVSTKIDGKTKHGTLYSRKEDGTYLVKFGSLEKIMKKR